MLLIDEVLLVGDRRFSSRHDELFGRRALVDDHGGARRTSKNIADALILKAGRGRPPRS